MLFHSEESEILGNNAHNRVAMAKILCVPSVNVLNFKRIFLNSLKIIKLNNGHTCLKTSVIK